MELPCLVENGVTNQCVVLRETHNAEATAVGERGRSDHRCRLRAILVVGEDESGLLSIVLTAEGEFYSAKDGLPSTIDCAVPHLIHHNRVPPSVIRTGDELNVPSHMSNRGTGIQDTDLIVDGDRWVSKVCEVEGGGE